MTAAAARLAPYPESWDDVEAPPIRARPWPPRRQTLYELACNLRDGLRAALGGCCRKCGTKDELEFHHPGGRSWVAAKKNLNTRMRLYWQDYRKGLLELLCSGCNKSAGMPNGFWQRAKTKRRRRR